MPQLRRPHSWRGEVISAERWLRLRGSIRRVLPGEAGGFLARAERSGTIAYLKPTVIEEGRFRAAYEKIASDLAHDVGLNVPGAILYRREEVRHDEPICVVLSEVPAERLLEWGDIEGIFPGGGRAAASLTDWSAVREALAGASGIVAFDAWLDNRDRNNPRNGLAAITHDSADLWFVDFSNSMDFAGCWTQGHAGDFPPMAIPQSFAAALRRRDILAVAERIRDLHEGSIENVVSRLPQDFLPAPEAKRLTEWLIGRKRVLCDRIGDWYPRA